MTRKIGEMPAEDPRVATEFANDVPSEEIVYGLGAFVEDDRRNLLFIEMIGLAAKDLCQPPGTKLHEDSMRWLDDVDNLAAWCCLIEADPERAPIVRKAILDRPGEMAEACETMLRIAGTRTARYDHFMEMMGVRSRRNRSSVFIEEDADIRVMSL